MRSRSGHLVKAVGLSLVVALTAAACGDSDGDGSDTSASDIDVEAAAEATLDHFDGDAVTAAGAVLQAVDRGYTLEQIEAAVDRDAFDRHGFVYDDDSLVEPEDEPTDVISGKADKPSAGEALRLVSAIRHSQVEDTYDLDRVIDDGLTSFLDQIAEAREESRRQAEAEARRRDALSGRYMLMFIFDLVRLGVPLPDAIELMLNPVDLTDCFNDGYSIGCVDLDEVGGKTAAADDASRPDDAIDTRDGAWGVSFDVMFPGTDFIAGEGSFDVTDDGTISGTASFEIVSEGTCTIDEIDQIEPYRFVGRGSYEITGTRSGDSLAMTWTPTGGSITAREGDESKLCVEINRDVVEAFFTPVLSLPVTIPAADGTHSTESVIEDPEDPEDALPLPLEVTVDAPED